MKTKYCTFCDKEFEVPNDGEVNFHWRSVKDGIRYRLRCIQKHRSYQKVYVNSAEKYAHYIYIRIKHRCTDPKDISYKNYKGKLHIDEDTFKSWAIPALIQFKKDNNIKEEYHSGISIDKIDDEIGYKLGNLRWVFLQENIDKGLEKRKRKVGQYTLENKLVKTWDFVNQTREGGFHPGNVTSTCKGQFKQYRGFLWKYID